MLKIFSFLSVLIFLMNGCAAVEVTRITDANPYKEGVRFYRPHPYLWVTQDKEKGILQGTIIWLPNKKEEYAIKVKSGFGSVDAKIKLADGWNLTEFGEVRDSKIPETITALTGLTKIVKLAKGEKPTLKAGLYKLIFDNKTGLISGIEPVVQFE